MFGWLFGTSGYIRELETRLKEASDRADLYEKERDAVIKDMSDQVQAVEIDLKCALELLEGHKVGEIIDRG